MSGEGDHNDRCEDPLRRLVEALPPAHRRKLEIHLLAEEMEFEHQRGIDTGERIDPDANRLFSAIMAEVDRRLEKSGPECESRSKSKRSTSLRQLVKEVDSDLQKERKSASWRLLRSPVIWIPFGLAATFLIVLFLPWHNSHDAPFRLFDPFEVSFEKIAYRNVTRVRGEESGLCVLFPRGAIEDNRPVFRFSLGDLSPDEVRYLRIELMDPNGEITHQSNLTTVPGQDDLEYRLPENVHLKAGDWVVTLMLDPSRHRHSRESAPAGFQIVPAGRIAEIMAGASTTGNILLDTQIRADALLKQRFAESALRLLQPHKNESPVIHARRILLEANAMAILGRWDEVKRLKREHEQAVARIKSGNA